MSGVQDRTDVSRPVCTSCGLADSVVPLAFGFPSPDMFEAAERGEISLGGCCLPEGLRPHWRCEACHVELP